MQNLYVFFYSVHRYSLNIQRHSWTYNLIPKELKAKTQSHMLRRSERSIEKKEKIKCQCKGRQMLSKDSTKRWVRDWHYVCWRTQERRIIMDADKEYTQRAEKIKYSRANIKFNFFMCFTMWSDHKHRSHLHWS